MAGGHPVNLPQRSRNYADKLKAGTIEDLDVPKFPSRPPTPGESVLRNSSRFPRDSLALQGGAPPETVKCKRYNTLLNFLTNYLDLAFLLPLTQVHHGANVHMLAVL